MLKTFIGYHKADGGKVYKYTKENTTLAYFSCDFCKASSIDNTLQLSSIDKDIKNIIAIFNKNEIPGTEDEYKYGYASLLSAAELIGGNIFEGDLNKNIYTFGKLITDASSTINDGQTSVYDQFNELVYSFKTNSSTVIPDGTFGDGAYINLFYGEGLTQIDSTVRLEFSTTDNYFEQTSADLYGELVTTTYTLTADTSEIYFVGIGPSATDTTLSAWDAYSGFVAVSVSVDGGTTYQVREPVIRQIQAAEDKYTLYAAIFTFKKFPGNQLKLKLGFYTNSVNRTGIFGYGMFWYSTSGGNAINEDLFNPPV